MQSFRAFPAALKSRIRFVLTDIDDTLTLDGRLPAMALAAMGDLQAAGIQVIAITGRPSGWCDHMARMWPITGVVGENGALYFAYDPQRRQMHRGYWKSASERRDDRRRLADIEATILKRVPGCRVSADQAYREADLAIDFCEDVDPLPMAAAVEIKRLFEQAGARAKISSIHVNGWFGDYDKLSMTRTMLSEAFSIDMDDEKERFVFVGDSPNDAPMFGFFPHAVAVANIRDFAAQIDTHPPYVTRQRAGAGFVEVAEFLLAGDA